MDRNCAWENLGLRPWMGRFETMGGSAFLAETSVDAMYGTFV
jgi:hypothetical protein